mgnify:CR=1 FL=1
MSEKKCGACNGQRLNTAAAHVEVQGYTLAQLTSMPVDELLSTCQKMSFSKQELLSPRQPSMGKTLAKSLQQRRE